MLEHSNGTIAGVESKQNFTAEIVTKNIQKSMPTLLALALHVGSRTAALHAVPFVFKAELCTGFWLLPT